MNLEKLKAAYEKKYAEKVGKGYTEVKMALGGKGKEAVEVKIKEEVKKEVKVPDSKLDRSLQALIEFIFDMSLIEKSVV